MPSIIKLTIGVRLAASFVLVLAFLIVLTTVGVIQVGKIDNSLTTISNVNGVRERYAINFRGSVHNRAIALSRPLKYLPPSCTM